MNICTRYEVKRKGEHEFNMQSEKQREGINMRLLRLENKINIILYHVFLRYTITVFFRL